MKHDSREHLHNFHKRRIKLLLTMSECCASPILQHEIPACDWKLNITKQKHALAMISFLYTRDYR